jgi:hypothetical protein
VCLICNWIKKRREPRAKHVTLKLWRVIKADLPKRHMEGSFLRGLQVS